MARSLHGPGYLPLLMFLRELALKFCCLPSYLFPLANLHLNPCSGLLHLDQKSELSG